MLCLMRNETKRVCPLLAGRTSGGTSAAVCQPRSRALRPGHARRSRSLAASSSLDEAAAAAASGSSERGAADAVQPAPSGSQAADQLSAEDIAADYLQHCQQEYGRPGLIEFTEGAGGLPKAVLMHPGGARAEVYLHGGAVTSWRHADGREMLHLRDGNAFDGEQPIRWGTRATVLQRSLCCHARCTPARLGPLSSRCWPARHNSVR